MSEQNEEAASTRFITSTEPISLAVINAKHREAEDANRAAANANDDAMKKVLAELLAAKSTKKTSAKD